MPLDERRLAQRERLVLCAEARITEGGLAALRARDLARDMGCAVGAIYNLVADLDELVLLVARRTLEGLGASLDATADGAADSAPGDILVAWAHAYLRFGLENRQRWEALFQFRLPPGKPLPEWFEQEQARLFSRLEDRLAPLTPDLAPAARQLRARMLFSAVHGIVALGLDEKVAAVAPSVIAAELEAFLRTYVRGLQTPASPRDGAMPFSGA